MRIKHKQINYNEISFISDPRNLTFCKDIGNSPYTKWDLDNSFAVFNSVNNDNLLVYEKENLSLECYDINNDKILATIRKAHKNFISFIKHYYDKKNNRDIILCGDGCCSCIKIWDVKDWKVIIKLEGLHSDGFMFSACYFIDNNNNKDYVISSSESDNECIKIWKLDGTLEKEIDDSDDKYTSFIDIYKFNDNDKNINKNRDNNSCSKYYIISGNNKYFKSFDFNENKLYNKYHDRESYEWHDSGIVEYNKNEKDGIKKLIETSKDENIRIWDFDSGKMLKKIKTNTKLIGICFWNYDYLFIAGDDKEIKLFDNKSGNFIKDFKGNKDRVCSIKKIILPNLGECLVSQAWNKGGIKLWKIDNK